MEELSLPTEQRSYLNVMETLVVQEAGQQLEQLPAKTRQHIKLEEVITYALNRLPTLYACSQKGLQHQHQLAEHNLQHKIEDTVRQAISAVQVDPIRLSKPLQMGQDKDAEAVLQALRVFLKVPDLDWATALKQVNALKQRSQGARQRKAGHRPQTWQPDAHGSEVAWTPRHRQPETGSGQPPSNPPESESKPQTGWDDARYRL
ncbi:MAG: late competence development ComFB family protein [Leptolyngbya sp. SIO1E4]|nr:late competence development ComFB family protein [Leptolyngbya sp. SIO1E4]